MEFLKEVLGEDLYEQVAEKLSGNKDVRLVNLQDGEYVKKEKFKSMEARAKEVEQQIAERDAQLEELKKVDANALQEKIAKLQEENTAAVEQHEANMARMQLDYAVESALMQNKARNPKAVSSLLNMEHIKLDGETLLGLDEQLKSIKESDPYLFDGSDPVPGAPNRGQQKQSITKEEFNNMSYSEMVRFQQENPTLFEQLKKG